MKNGWKKSVGILASADPVALDQACVDFEFGAVKDDATRTAWEKHHSVNVLEVCRKIKCRETSLPYGFRGLKEKAVVRRCVIVLYLYKRN